MKFTVNFLLIFLLYKKTSACSCPEGAFQKSREESICDSYSYSSDVYVATVEAAYCKCLPNDTSTTTFSCIQYSDDGNGVAGTAEATYECTRPAYLLSTLASCSDVTAGATGSDEVTVSPTIISPTINISNIDQCGLDVDVFNAAYEEANCSILVGNPCIYTVRVGMVYKGSHTTGTAIAVLGPDVLTSCGQYGRVLTIGPQYLVGIGGPCNRFGAWSEISNYGESELAYLQTLKDDPSTNCSTSSTVTPSTSVSGTTPSISTGAIAGFVAVTIGFVIITVVAI